MRTIYASASKMLVLLGEASDSSELASSLLNDLARFLNQACQWNFYRDFTIRSTLKLLYTISIRIGQPKMIFCIVNLKNSLF